MSRFRSHRRTAKLVSRVLRQGVPKCTQLRVPCAPPPHCRPRCDFLLELLCSSSFFFAQHASRQLSEFSVAGVQVYADIASTKLPQHAGCSLTADLLFIHVPLHTDTTLWVCCRPWVAQVDVYSISFFLVTSDVEVYKVMNTFLAVSGGF